jgi:hypothetical protein
MVDAMLGADLVERMGPWGLTLPGGTEAVGERFGVIGEDLLEFKRVRP